LADDTPEMLRWLPHENVVAVEKDPIRTHALGKLLWN